MVEDFTYKYRQNKRSSFEIFLDTTSIVLLQVMWQLKSRQAWRHAFISLVFKREESGNKDVLLFCPSLLEHAIWNFVIVSSFVVRDQYIVYTFNVMYVELTTHFHEIQQIKEILHFIQFWLCANSVLLLPLENVQDPGSR